MRLTLLVASQSFGGCCPLTARQARERQGVPRHARCGCMRSINAALDALDALDALEPRIFNPPIPRSARSLLPPAPTLNACASKDKAKMSKARAGAAVDQIVKLVVGAGQASPSPPVGPALGSKGIKSMDFCKA